jgi:hypothetical protein
MTPATKAHPEARAIRLRNGVKAAASAASVWTKP